ncbi:hypothetical protein [Zobellia nedashkovskayae]|uniref:hypothetical protein n=1 Tax=Zobellia nedashkovskayae TaxID=2779510 RepID=UPI00188CE4F5|nr:hypothetical protein [Zobellia nedashkovskayae]
MKKFITTSILFIVVGIIVGELIARLFVISPDIPKRSIDQWGVQKYIPNQVGTWKGGEHSWQINKLGWPGILPSSNENLITIIGDSFIENFMNPDSCHQKVYLKNRLPQFNFLEASRSGVNFLEATLIADQLDSLEPKYQLLYLYDSDFKESITQLNKNKQITQFDVSKKEIIQAELQSSLAKNTLYNLKFIYYLYSHYWQQKEPATKTLKKEKLPDLESMKILLSSFSDSVRTNNRILVFRPGTNHNIIRLCKNMGYKYIILRKLEDQQWSFDYDSHWTCFGHNEAARQIVEKLNQIANNRKALVN